MYGDDHKRDGGTESLLRWGGSPEVGKPVPPSALLGALMTEIWFRDPFGYVDECASLLVSNICWEGRLLDQRGVDPQTFFELHYPQTFDYRMLVVRHDGTPELRRGYSPDMPAAVYQTWSYDEESLDDLEDMLANPPGEDMELCTDPATPVNSRPVYGQEHRVIVTRWPDARTTIGRSFLRVLSRYQKEYPEVIIHLWGTDSFRALFGMGLASADFDAETQAKYKVVFLPNGRRVHWEQTQEHPQWIRLLGFSQPQLARQDKRVEFNIKSAQWAAQYFETDIKFKSTGYDPVDPNNYHHLPATSASVMSRKIVAQHGDKVTCDSCSLFAACKYYRAEAVCTLPSTNTAKLAGFFATRSSDVIIEGLGKVLAVQAGRFERATEDEEYTEKIDPNVTRLGHVLVQDGTTLAKLVDPTLAAAGAARVQAFFGGQHIHATAGSLVAEIVRELEGKGVPRNDITDEMVNEFIKQQHQEAIEVESRDPRS